MATKTGAPKGYVSIDEAAAYTGLSAGTIRNLLATLELTAFRPVPGRIVLDIREVERFVRKSAGRRSTRGQKPRGTGAGCRA